MAEDKKQKIDKQKALQKEREKAAVEKALEREKEKQKEVQRRAIEKALQKEREKIREQLVAGKDPFADTKPLSKLVMKKASEILNTPKEIVYADDEDKIVEPEEKKSLEEILKEKEDEKSEEHFNHVEMLRKKREAQMKLNEQSEKEAKDAELKAKLQARALENQMEMIAKTEEEVDEETVVRLEELSEENARLVETVESLTEELKSRDEIINKQDNELKEMNEKLTILSNTVIAEKNKEKEKEPTVQENPYGIDNKMLVEIKEQGDILIRIRLLNERIAEKDAQIQIVEDELNKLTEQDIFEKEFIVQIRKVRIQRQEQIKQSNYELENLAQSIRSNEEKLKNKELVYKTKQEELQLFDKNYQDKKLNYTEKEEMMKKRSPLIAEVDVLACEVEALKENYNKLVNRYKETLRRAELICESLNKEESDLIQLYLKKLRDKKSNENEEYLSQKEEREVLLTELNKLSSSFEKIQENIKEQTPELHKEVKVKDVGVDEVLENLKKNLAAVEGKLRLLVTRRDERHNVEEVLRKTDKDVKEYLAIFNEKEIATLEITETEKKLDKLYIQINESQGNHSELVRLGNICAKYEVVVAENKAKAKQKELELVKYENNEKVIFYKQLIRSILELDTREQSLKNKAKELREKIIAREESN